MPELPEAEVVARQIRSRLLGARLTEGYGSVVKISFEKATPPCLGTEAPAYNLSSGSVRALSWDL